MEVLPPNQLGHRCLLAVAVSTGTFDQQSPVKRHYIIPMKKKLCNKPMKKKLCNNTHKKGGKQTMVIDQMCKLHNLIFFKNGSV
jgi:hypothetical protein